MRVLLFLLVALLVNLPYSQERWNDHRVAADGIEVEAAVLGERDTGDGFLVDYQLPEDIDPRRTRYSAAVDRPTYDNAQATDLLAVRVLPSDPDVNRPLGLVPSSLFKVIAITADVVLLAIALIAWYRRRTDR